jgi:hypothetical protein
MLRVLAALGGGTLLIVALADAFDTIVLARRAQRIFRLTGWFYSITWAVFTFFCKKVESGGRRERILSTYGSFSLLALLAIWVTAIVFAFTLLHWAAGLRLRDESSSFGLDMFYSASALFTMMVAGPLNTASRILVVLEGALGFALLGLVVGISAGALSVVCRSRTAHLADGRARGLAFRGNGADSSPGTELRETGSLARRVGAVGVQRSRDASFLPDALLFSFATRKPVLAGNTGQHPGRERADSGERRRRFAATGETDVRNGTPHASRSGERVPAETSRTRHQRPTPRDGIPAPGGRVFRASGHHRSGEAGFRRAV